MKFYDFLDRLPPIPALVVVEGGESLLADRVCTVIEERLGDGVDVDRFVAPQLASFRPIAEALPALGLFASRRLVIVRGIHELRVAARRAIWEVAQTVAEPTTLVLEDLLPPNKKTGPEPLGRLAEGRALRIDTTADSAVRRRFVEEFIADSGARLQPDALTALAASTVDLASMRNDLEKLVLMDAPIDLAALVRERLVTDEPKAYQYASALLNGEEAVAYATIAEMFRDDPRGAAVPLFSALATEYALLAMLTQPRGALPARYRWRERSLRPLAQRLGPRVTRRGFERALRGFEAIVTGRTDEPRLCVEMITAECAYERAAALRRR